MFRAIKHGLGNLVNFSGRDARQPFWFYVLFIYLVLMAVTLVIVVPAMLQAFMAAIRAASAASQSGDPLAAQAASEAAMFGAMSGTMETMAWAGSVSNIVMMALLASALVRRLHDSDLSGWWALLPAAAQIASVILAPALTRQMMDGMGGIEADPELGMRSMQQTSSLASLVGWGPIIIVIFLGIRQSTPGPNRYGETPFTA